MFLQEKGNADCLQDPSKAQSASYCCSLSHELNSGFAFHFSGMKIYIFFTRISPIESVHWLKKKKVLYLEDRFKKIPWPWRQTDEDYQYAKIIT